MRRRKSTLRVLPEIAREIAKLGNEAHSLSNRLQNLALKIQVLETDKSAYEKVLRGKGYHV